MTIADAVMFTHLGVVVFNASLLVLIPIGRRRWAWVHHRPIRLLHLFMMLFIAVQTLLGQHCPLTLLEVKLRADSSEGMFLARVVHDLLYWNLPLAFFAALYLLCTAWAIWLWFFVPPHAKCSLENSVHKHNEIDKSQAFEATVIKQGSHGEF